MTLTADRPVRAPGKRGPGRPRNDDLDDRILNATLELIDAGEHVTVARIVEQGGVNRAAIYRRWSSLTDLIAAALDVGRQVPPSLDLDGDLHDQIIAMVVGPESPAATGDYGEARFRQRISLAMADRSLQRAYWKTHVTRRRVVLKDAIRAGIARGILRADVDPAAAFDLIAGVAYYQLVVRGAPLDDREVRRRCRDAIEIAWRGMLADPAQPDTDNHPDTTDPDS